MREDKRVFANDKRSFRNGITLGLTLHQYLLKWNIQIITAQDYRHTAPLERKNGLTFFYKHLAPLERKIKHAISVNLRFFNLGRCGFRTASDLFQWVKINVCALDPVRLGNRTYRNGVFSTKLIS